MKGFKLTILFIAFSISNTFAQTGVESEINYLKIDFLPAFENSSSLEIDRQKTISVLSIENDNEEIVVKEIISDSIFENCEINRLFIESELFKYQINPDEIQKEDGLIIRIYFKSKQIDGIIDAGNTYDESLSNILSCTLLKTRNLTKDSLIINYLDRLIGYF
ncbi:hypothetical protein ACE1ET_20575 [Saccharicrinis sp. FJH62]|uniref:hypothetical protein n=1 Tax=Saccharicrinis sp. FJH62 TaxID=3344657 RepID=UPI0035D40611